MIYVRSLAPCLVANLSSGWAEFMRSNLVEVTDDPTKVDDGAFLGGIGFI
jgi:hypothetical protein